MTIFLKHFYSYLGQFFFNFLSKILSCTSSWFYSITPLIPSGIGLTIFVRISQKTISDIHPEQTNFITFSVWPCLVFLIVTILAVSFSLEVFSNKSDSRTTTTAATGQVCLYHILWLSLLHGSSIKLTRGLESRYILHLCISHVRPMTQEHWLLYSISIAVGVNNSSTTASLSLLVFTQCLVDGRGVHISVTSWFVRYHTLILTDDSVMGISSLNE